MAGTRTGGGSGFEVGGPTRVCAASGEPLEVGAPYVATLVEHPEEDGLRRVDFSAAAWDGGARPGPPLRLFGKWRSIVPDPASPRGPVVDSAELTEILEQLDGVEDAAGKAFRFLVALLLLRKRKVVQLSSRPGVLVLRLRGDARDGPPLEVEDPGLDEAAMADAMVRLGTVVDFGDEASS